MKRLISILLSGFCFIAISKQRIIGGGVVDSAQYKEVIKITSENGTPCTATVIGPRVIATAATCAKTGTKVSFSIDRVPYSAQITQSPLFPNQDHDLSLGLLPQELPNIKPATVGKTATVGLGISLLGYGCSQSGGGGAIDGKLRKGETTIIQFNNFDFVSKKDNGAAICFGDQGGPAYVIENGTKYLLGVNSKGNLTDKTYSVQTQINESQTFLKNFAQQNNVKICGINMDCAGGSPPPPPPPDGPTCTLDVNPAIVQLGQSITIRLQSQGTVVAAEIDGTPVSFPTGQKNFTPQNTGQQFAWGKVTGPTGTTGTCKAQYTVQGSTPPTTPTCSITATPSFVVLGQPVTLTLKVQGEATDAAIDGVAVNIPIGTREFTPAQKGTYHAWGAVLGPAGSGACRTQFTVGDTPPPPPEPPNFTLVPTHCGNNTLETKVMQVCLAKVKRNLLLQQMIIEDVILIIYEDQTKEIMPIIHRKEKPKKQANESVEDLVFYSNGLIKAGPHTLMDTRPGILTRKAVGTATLEPKSIEGRSAQGQYFVVEQLGPDTSQVDLD